MVLKQSKWVLILIMLFLSPLLQAQEFVDSMPGSDYYREILRGGMDEWEQEQFNYENTDFSDKYKSKGKSKGKINKSKLGKGMSKPDRNGSQNSNELDSKFGNGEWLIDSSGNYLFIDTTGRLENMGFKPDSNRLYWDTIYGDANSLQKKNGQGKNQNNTEEEWDNENDNAIIEKSTKDLDYYEKKKNESEMKPKTSNLSAYKAKPMSGFIKVVLFILLGVLLFILGYFIYKNSGNFKSKKSKVTATDEINAENLANLDVEREMHVAKEDRDLRLAVRVLYLKNLKKLFEKGYVWPSAEKTNYDYYLEIKEQRLRPGFQKLTQYFEHVWYGEKVPTLKDFEAIEQEYELYYSSI